MQNFRLPFGSFKGELFQETPFWYQKWLLNQEWFKEKYLKTKKKISK